LSLWVTSNLVGKCHRREDSQRLFLMIVNALDSLNYECAEFCVSGLKSYYIRNPHHSPPQKEPNRVNELLDGGWKIAIRLKTFWAKGGYSGRSRSSWL